MSSVFVSYKREDQRIVHRLCEALEAKRFAVWWDRDLSGGGSWRANIEAALASAGCVIVVWSRHSTAHGAEFVWDEASHAARRGVLVPVRIDKSRPPLGFGEFQTLDLAGWRGRQNDPRFQDLVATVHAKLARQKPPAPTWPKLKTRRRIVYWVGSALSVLALGAIVVVPPCALCKVPGIRTVCALSGRLQVKTTREETLVLPQTVVPQLAGSENEAIAREQALTEGNQDARDRVCSPYNAMRNFELLSASSIAQRWNCREGSSGVSCGFDGQAQCRVSVHEVSGDCP